MRSSRMNYLFHLNRNILQVKRPKKINVNAKNIRRIIETFDTDECRTLGDGGKLEQMKELAADSINEMDIHTSKTPLGARSHEDSFDDNENTTEIDKENERTESSDKAFVDFANLHENDLDETNVYFMNDDFYEEPVHPHLQATRFEVMHILMHLYMRHNLTKAALEDILQMINFIVGFKTLPEKYRKFEFFFSKNTYTRHYVCHDCGLYIGETEDRICSNCEGDNVFFFVMFDFITNLRDILRRNWFEIQKYKNKIKSESDICDIVNAGVLKNCTDENSISLCFNTDGVKMFNSNIKRSLWPIIVIVNELPPALRFSRQNALIGGLWLSYGEPDINVFMKPFFQSLEKLFLEGLNIGFTHIPCIRTIACCVDTKARCKIQNMKQFNGYQACGYCLHPGHLTSKGQIKYGYIKEICTRNHSDTVQAMALSDARGIPVNGVKGISPLILIPEFDTVRYCPIDYMHGILLGVTKQLCRIWFEKPNTPCYIKSQIGHIDNILNTIVPFKEASRSARKISDRRSWKANEWLHWLLHYSSVCLRDVLPTKYYNHYRILVIVISDLLQNKISHNMLDSYNRKLHHFVADFESLYTLNEMNYNVHLLTHITNCCENYGPLWAFSLFFFEDVNGVLKNYVKGPKEPLLQIAHRCAMSHTRYNLQFILNFRSTKLRTPAITLCQKITCLKKIEAKRYQYILPSDISNPYSESNKFEELSQLKHNGFMYRAETDSQSANGKRKMNNDCFFSNDNGIYGKIIKILTDGNKNYFLFKHIETNFVDNGISTGKIDDGIIKLIMIDDSCRKCIRITCKNILYFCHLQYTLKVD